MLTHSLNKIIRNQHLTEQEAFEIIDYISTGNANSFQIAAFLSALSTKGFTAEEITGFASAMREKAQKIDISGMDNVVDSCGTGGDCTNTFNISTASALAAAAAGLKVAKHSNFRFTSKCGSSNVIKELGLHLSQNSEEAEKHLKNHSIALIHAPFFHKSTFHVNQVRKELGIRTIFNYLGPLTNPAKPVGQIIGVSNPEIMPEIVQALKNLGCRKAMVVCGIDPVMDEISICGKTSVYELNNGKISNYEIVPGDFGMQIADLNEIKGDTPEVNAKIITDIFKGQIKGAKLDILLLNTGAVIWAGNRADSLSDGINLATEVIRSGRATAKLEELS